MLKLRARSNKLNSLHNPLAKDFGKGVVVGLSGGADSVALLFVLLENGENVFAVHVNHNMRGEESDGDELFVRELCKRLSVSLKVVSVTFDKFSEETAREARYAAFEDARVEFGADCIAVGHNLDDNAETMIMNMCRGASLRGLCGIPPINGRIVRPLIDVTRAEIEEYLKEKNIEYRHDGSNASNDYTRNRVRNIVLPMMEREVSPNARKAMVKNSALLRMDEEYMDGVAREAFEKNVIRGERMGIRLNPLLELHPAIVGRVFRIAVSEVLGGATVDIYAGHIADVLRLAAEGHSGREIHLPRVIVSKEYDVLFFLADRGCAGFSYTLPFNSCIYIPEIKKTVLVSDEQIACTKVFSCDKIKEPLLLRTRLPGDKLSFKDGSGRVFTKKLQDYFTDEKIPKGERDRMPLLAHGSDILWVTGTDRTNAKYEAGKDKNIYIKW
ncbi:MAG: tRNA lysidine(34) synthetase TilS [Defluviitaleaceae bacterium]|nr:tRNA lysidine(34) synthetase TilS [Defluviitaleaceae bacterium]